MIDFLFYSPFTIKQNKTACFKSKSGIDIQQGEFYIEEDDLTVHSLIDTSPIDFFGDLELEENDYKTIEGSELDKQDMYIRAFSDRKDFAYFEDIGANLSDIRGKFNEVNTAAQAIDMLRQSFFVDRRFNMNEIEIDAFPVSHDTIMMTIKIDGDDTLVFPIEL